MNEGGLNICFFLVFKLLCIIWQFKLKAVNKRWVGGGGVGVAKWHKFPGPSHSKCNQCAIGFKTMLGWKLNYYQGWAWRKYCNAETFPLREDLDLDFNQNNEMFKQINQVTRAGEEGGIADEAFVLIKSFESPEALSRHKSRQQKAFTNLTQN